MDQPNPMILDTLKGFLPAQTMELLQDHLSNPNSALQAIYRQTATLLNKLFSLVYPLIEPLLTRVLQALHDSPDIVVLGFALAVFVFILQLVAWVHRTMMYFTRLAFRLLGWALVFAVVAAVWRRGPEAAIRDVVVVVSKLAGYAAVVKDIWLSEYQKFDAQTKRGGGSESAPSGGYSRSRNSRW